RCARMLRLRCKTKNGSHVMLGLTPQSCVQELKSKVEELTGIPCPVQKIMVGYPPSSLDLRNGDARLKDLPVKSGRTGQKPGGRRPKGPFLWGVCVCVVFHRGHTHRGGGEDQGQASGAVGHHQSPPPGRVPPAGPPGGPGRQLLPLHQRLLRGGGGRLRPRLCPRDAGPHRPDGVQRPRRLLGGGAGEDQRAVLRVDKAGRHLGGRHRAVHPVQVLPVRDLRGGHADGARGPLRRGRGLPEARAAHLRRHPLRPAAERAARLRRPAPHHLLHQRRRHPGPGPGAGRRRPPQAPVHRRHTASLCAAWCARRALVGQKEAREHAKETGHTSFGEV
ncbi:unnamed protein product, partial [Tetraodon nigroviridis]